MTVLYRDLPKYNDRRRNLWLPEVVQQHLGLRRTISNPSLYGRDEPGATYSAAEQQNSPRWDTGSVGEGVVMLRRRVDSARSLSISNSTASFPSKRFAMLFTGVKLLHVLPVSDLQTRGPCLSSFLRYFLPFSDELLWVSLQVATHYSLNFHAFGCIMTSICDRTCRKVGCNISLV